MNERKILHDIVDSLPDSELITAARILTALNQPVDRLEVRLQSAPLDDEPDDDDFDGGLTEARSEKPIRHDELLRRLEDK